MGINVVPHTPETLKEVMEKENLHWRSFADDGTITRKWNSPATPAFYVLDPKGVIRHKWIGHPGEKTIDNAIEKLIEQAERGILKRRKRLGHRGNSGTRLRATKRWSR